MRRLRVALVVPIPVDRGREGAEHAFHGPSLAHTKALAGAGAEAHLLLPSRSRGVEDLGGGAYLHRVPAPVGLAVPAAMAATLLKLSPDVVHLFHFRNIPTLYALSRLPFPLFGEYNGGTTPRSWLKRRLMQQALDRCAGIFFTAAEQARAFEGLRFPTIIESPEVSARPLPTFDRQAARSALRVEGAPLVLAVARLEPPKDPWTILNAFQAVYARRPTARLLWLDGANRGAQRREIEAAIVERGLRHAIEIRDHLNTEDMGRAYSAADVMIHASTREICGHAFMEGLSFGLPIAASHIPPFRRLASAADGIVLCQVGNVESFASAIAHASPWGAVSARRSRFEASLSWTAIGRARTRGYLSAVGGSEPPNQPDEFDQA